MWLSIKDCKNKNKMLPLDSQYQSQQDNEKLQNYKDISVFGSHWMQLYDHQKLSFILVRHKCIWLRVSNQ